MVEIACLECCEPRNRIWKHYSWKTKEANWEMFGGNKQTIQELDQPEPQESLDLLSKTAPTADCLFLQ